MKNITNARRLRGVLSRRQQEIDGLVYELKQVLGMNIDQDKDPVSEASKIVDKLSATAQSSVRVLDAFVESSGIAEQRDMDYELPDEEKLPATVITDRISKGIVNLIEATKWHGPIWRDGERQFTAADGTTIGVVCEYNEVRFYADKNTETCSFCLDHEDFARVMWKLNSEADPELIF